VILVLGSMRTLLRALLRGLALLALSGLLCALLAHFGGSFRVVRKIARSGALIFIRHLTHSA